MPFHGTSLLPVAFESGRYVIVAQTPRIEPIFNRSDGAVVLERTSIPDAPQRRNFVISRAPACLELETGIGSYGSRKDVEAREILFRRRESHRRRQFVIRIERRRMT